MTDNGTIKTGTVHPLRESISHPYAAVPHSSNVNQDAGQDYHVLKAPTTPPASPLHSPTDSDENAQGKEAEKDA